MKIIEVKVLQFHAVSHVIRDSEFHTHPGPEHDSIEKVLVIKCDDGTEGLAFGPMDERVILSTIKDILIFLIDWSQINIAVSILLYR